MNSPDLPRPGVTQADTSISRRSSLSQVVAHLGAAQKSSRGAAAYSRWVNRPLGRRFAALAYRGGATPDLVTGISALLTFTGIAIVAAAPVAPVTGLVVTVLLVLGYALDAADGQLARLTGTGSLRGEWLDHVIDCAKVSAVHLAVLIAWYRLPEPGHGWLAVPLVFCLEAAVFFFAMILIDQQRRRAGVTSPGTRTGGSVLRSLVVIPNDYGLLCLLFLFWAWPRAFAPVYALLAAANLALLMVALVRWYRELTEIDRSRTPAADR